MKILIAEDDGITRRILKSAVQQEGYEAIWAADGCEALRLINEQSNIDMVLLDWLMPGIEGVELLRRIKNRQNSPYIYSIMLSAKNASEDVVYGLEEGADDYITKPFHMRELISRLKAGKRIVEMKRMSEETISALRAKWDRYKGTPQMIPICSACKKIRDEDELWQHLEQYFGDRHDISFTHSICPECNEKLYK